MLLHSNHRQDAEILDTLVSTDFEEIGSDGYVSSREEVIKWLLDKAQTVKYVLEDFRIKIISEELVLASYLAIKVDHSVSKGSRRSSIWKKTNSSYSWEIIFHQGSKVL